MSCAFLPTDIVAVVFNQTYIYSDFIESIARNASCGTSTYFRPDIGGALMPFLYTIIILVVHVPTVCIRATRWEKAQILNLWLAAFNIALTLQGYGSTKLQPEGVLVWMPLMLPIDAGALLMMIVLIVEEYKFRPLWDGLRRKNDRRGTEIPGGTNRSLHKRNSSKPKLMQI